MKGTAIFILSLFFINANKKNNVLTETRWKFVGLLYTSSNTLNPCPSDVSYTIDFNFNNEVTGLATIPYKGKYWIKKSNYIKTKVFISKATLPGKSDSMEFEWRLNYSKYLGMGGKFVLKEKELQISSNEYVTMIFARIE